MTELELNKQKQTISVEVKSMSMHALGFEITVYDTDQTTEVEKSEGTTQANATFHHTLNSQTDFYKGKYIQGIFVFRSIDGKDITTYKAIFSIYNNDEKLMPEIIMEGKTTGGKAKVIKTFHLN